MKLVDLNLDDIEHSHIVAYLAMKMCRRIHLNEEHTKSIYIAGLYHDVGKAYIVNNILNKPACLNESERTIMKKHPTHGYLLLRDSEYPDYICRCVLMHHECWDGSGYPKGASGAEIPLGARILKIADSYDAIRRPRSYKEPKNHEETINIMNASKYQFESDLYEKFLELCEAEDEWSFLYGQNTEKKSWKYASGV